MLRCRFCDTRYASWEPGRRDLSVEEILARRSSNWHGLPAARQPPSRHAVLTGGEPMLFAELVPLCAAPRRLGKHVTIETAGTLYLPVACDLMSISPKLSNSTPAADPGERAHRSARAQSSPAPDVIRRLNAEYDCQFKFVVDRPADCRGGGGLSGRIPGDRPRPGDAHAAGHRRGRVGGKGRLAGALLCGEPACSSVPAGTSSGSAAGGGHEGEAGGWRLQAGGSRRRNSAACGFAVQRHRPGHCTAASGLILSSPPASSL